MKLFETFWMMNESRRREFCENIIFTLGDGKEIEKENFPLETSSPLGKLLLCLLTWLEAFSAFVCLNTPQ